VTNFEPGEHYFDAQRWEELRPEGPHLWKTLGCRRTVWEPGRQVIEWEATEDYGFPTQSGYIIHGGLVTTILDTAMGGACWSLLNLDQSFLTADIHVDFVRATRPGPLRAEGRVVHKASRVIFCASELFDSDEVLLATARCTQVLLSSQGRAGRAFKDSERGSS